MRLFLLALLTACAGRAAAVSPPAPDLAHCQRIRDSVTALPIGALPAGGFRSRFTAPRLPAGVPSGAQVSIIFVAWSDGTPDLESIRIVGTTDSTYRRDVAARLANAQLVPARVGGCAVPSRVVVTTTKL